MSLQIILGYVFLLFVIGMAGVFLRRGIARIITWGLAVVLSCIGFYVLLWTGVDVLGPGSELGSCLVVFWPVIGLTLGEFNQDGYAEFFIAPREGAALYDRFRYEGIDGYKCRGVDIKDLSKIWAMVSGIEYTDALVDKFQCLLQCRENEGRRSIYQFPPDLVNTLSYITQDRVNEILLESNTEKGLSWSGRKIRDVVEKLSFLSVKALKKGWGVYLWNSK